MLRRVSQKIKQDINMTQIAYGKSIIDYSDITLFDECKTRNQNDESNKKRENIIGCILNNGIPNEYYDEIHVYGTKWQKIKQELHEFVTHLCEKEQIPLSYIENMSCKQKGGRGYHHDFDLILNNMKYNIEFKFNAQCVQDTPQFVSPMKPSKFLGEDFDDDDYKFENGSYHNVYIPVLSKYGMEIAPWDIYKKYVHYAEPEPTPNADTQEIYHVGCMKKVQDFYYAGCKRSSRYTNDPIAIQFYEDMKIANDDYICSFIQNTPLKCDVLTDHLLKTQNNKYYMLYKNGKFNLETIHEDEYIICTKHQIKKTKNSYYVVTKTGKKLKILLRWKNGNGIAYPGLQISLCK